ncbi:MAG: hypothetical protein ACOH2R_24810 [Pseudomonas sp.]
MLSAVIATMMLLAIGSLALSGHGREHGVDYSSVRLWRLVVGVLLAILAVLNANLWAPVQGIFLSVVLLSTVALGRAAITPSVRNVLWMPALTASTVVAIAALVVAFRVNAQDFWLLEGPNHDSLYYFQGAVWAWANPIHVAPDVVTEAWRLGSCTQGAVYIGTDCVGYRGGTYSMLALANGAARAKSGNTAQMLVALAALFPLLALLPALAKFAAAPQLRRMILVGSSISVLACLVFVAPGMTGAIANANVGTAFGSACVAMVFGLAVVPCPSPILRAFALGLATAIAGHVYGEAVVCAGYFAALGVVIDSIRTRRLAHFMIGGLVAFLTFLIGLNVVATELFESFTAIDAIAQGGQWAGWYLNAPVWTWIAAPFAGILLGADPAVTQNSLLVGGILSGVVAVVGLTLRQTRLATIAFGLLTALLIWYVEHRAYAYGEHKILQMLGPSASMLAAMIVVALVKSRGSQRERMIARLLAATVVLLMVAGAALFDRRVSVLMGDSILLHGLSHDFESGLLPVSNEDRVIIDDLGAVSVEKYQKTHYLGFLMQLRGAVAVLPEIGDDALRGGYLRNVAGDTLRSARSPRWLLQLKSEAGARSVFHYPAAAVLKTSEYDLIDLSRVPAALAAGNGWYGCEAFHCWTHEAFEIESNVSSMCEITGTARILMDIAFFSPPMGASFTASRSDGWSETHPALDGKVAIPLPVGWTRTTIKANWAPFSPRALGTSSDNRALFAMVKGASVECVRPGSVAKFLRGTP